MSIEQRLRTLEVLWRRGSGFDERVRRIAEEVAAEFGLPVESVMVEAEAIAARGPQTVEHIADEVADELGLDRAMVRAEAYVIWQEARKVQT